MKILYYHCFAGISGDMNLAAMVDLGVPIDYLKKELQKLPVKDYTILASHDERMGISGTKIEVNLKKTKPSLLHQSNHQHNEHRSYADIKKLILHSALDEKVKTTSLQIFDKIAVAEAKIHNKPVDTIHFHEVGATDSIVDVVGAAICYHFIAPDKVLCSTIELGGGMVNCAHGIFPVPAPATAEILAEKPVRLGTVDVETTTPTGAAILASLVDEYTDKLEFRLSKTAYGIGHRKMKIPNVLRVHLAEGVENDDLQLASATIIETNIDDMPAEHFEYLIDLLMAAGAQDVYLTPVIMKKSRPATKISVLCAESEQEELGRILLTESSSLGIRSYKVKKSMLRRQVVQVNTIYGIIDVKLGWLGNKLLKTKPEFDQCRKAAQQYNISLSAVLSEVQKKIQNIEL